MKIGIFETKFFKEKADFFSKSFAHKLPLFDFLNSYFDFVNYDYKIIDGKINVTSINDDCSDVLVIAYDFGDKIIINLGGMYLVTVEDITFEKKA